MVYDYDKLYRNSPDALGAPSALIRDFFAKNAPANAQVLDLGCGQGRDALFIARLGHRVLGVDLAPHGIRDMLGAAQSDSLPIDAVVCDISTFVPPHSFDVILFDRTLHMLPDRRAVLARYLEHVAGQGWTLIVDEPSHMAEYQSVLADHSARWRCDRRAKGCLFAQRS